MPAMASVPTWSLAQESQLLTPQGDLWQPGSFIDGRFQVLHELGSGGMGVVYQALDLQFSRHVALKVLDADMVAHPTARRRMQQEAEALSRIEHPNVVRLFEAFELDSRVVLVLELVAGGTLGDIIGDNGVTCRQALPLLAGILAGLQAIHDAQLVHRDVKPENVLLTAAGVPKLADLGVARDTQSTKQGLTTQLGTRLGTPYYMSPEQAQGLAVDARSDVFSMGVLAFELLTGQHAFDGPSEIEVLAAIVREPPPLQRLIGRCSPQTIDVIAQSLAKQVDDRFGSARAMARALALSGGA